mmetsp:Transcript_34073/g.75103  ORF Transcript_34073/g.75103 Transcript_34073/m.75103 type:complete len:202 (-) Transcript_34073:245-850(-)
MAPTGPGGVGGSICMAFGRGGYVIQARRSVQQCLVVGNLGSQLVQQFDAPQLLLGHLRLPRPAPLALLVQQLGAPLHLRPALLHHRLQPHPRCLRLPLQPNPLLPLLPLADLSEHLQLNLLLPALPLLCLCGSPQALSRLHLLRSALSRLLLVQHLSLGAQLPQSAVHLPPMRLPQPPLPVSLHRSHPIIPMLQQPPPRLS